jgi:hypothetical protein
MQLHLFLATLVGILTATLSCTGGSSSNFTEQRLRARIETAWSYFVKGDFEAFASMWSEQIRRDFQASEEDRKKTLRMWNSILHDKPSFELLDVEITDKRARVKMRGSTVEKGGSRGYDILYDYWVFENEEGFLDDAGRTK